MNIITYTNGVPLIASDSDWDGSYRILRRENGVSGS
jgi:hypothetical protein